MSAPSQKSKLSRWWGNVRFVKRKVMAYPRHLLSVLSLVQASFATTGKEAKGEIKISLLCPTRARPKAMARLWNSALQTASDPSGIEVVFYVDSDDITGMAGLALCARKHGAQVRAVVGERRILSECWNCAANIAEGEVFMHCGDDIVFRSQGWDKVVMDTMHSFKDRIAFVYGRDGLQDEKLGTHGFIHRAWVETLGYFVPPIFSSDYNDTWLNEVAERIGRKVYVPSIYTEHMHFAAKKGARDLTHIDRLKRHKEDDVDKLWEETQPLRIADAEKLQARINQMNG